MCGRFLLSLIPEEFAGLLRRSRTPAIDAVLFEPRMNIAPTEQIIIARDDGCGQGERELAAVRWGMIPDWIGSIADARRPIFNARAETVWSKPMFRDAVRTRRCVVPADGFYEWGQPSHPGGRKQQFLIRNSDHSPMFFAGIWSSWTPTAEINASPITTGAILTTSSNEAMAPIHDRMPVILQGQSAIDQWLDPERTDAASLRPLLTPALTGSICVCAHTHSGDNRRTNGGQDTEADPGTPWLFR